MELKTTSSIFKTNQLIVKTKHEVNLYESEKLHELIAAGEYEWTEGYKNRGADINYISPSCGHPILFMSLCTHYNNGMHIAKHLIELGANINIQNTRGTTLLMDIVQTNNLPYVKYLLDNNADVTLCDKSGFDALFYATMTLNYHKKHYTNDIIEQSSSPELDNLNKEVRNQRDNRIATAQAIVNLIKARMPRIVRK